MDAKVVNGLHAALSVAGITTEELEEALLLRVTPEDVAGAEDAVSELRGAGATDEEISEAVGALVKEKQEYQKTSAKNERLQLILEYLDGRLSPRRPEPDPTIPERLQQALCPLKSRKRPLPLSAVELGLIDLVTAQFLDRAEHKAKLAREQRGILWDVVTIVESEKAFLPALNPRIRAEVWNRFVDRVPEKAWFKTWLMDYSFRSL